jgi:pimeloyl-ACP methyl ester carboxylesterase
MTHRAGKRPTLILLPGLDGTGDLFRPLLQVLPNGLTTRVISYPPDQALSYAAASELVEKQLAEESSVVLLAESYSGPIALRYASAHSDRVKAVVLCASFICSPLPRWTRFVAHRWLFRFSPPAFALRRLMLHRDAPDSLVCAVTETIKKVKPRVMARRLKDVFNLRCEDALRGCTVPLLYLAASADLLVRAGSLGAIKAIKPEVRVCTVNGPHLLLQCEPLAAWTEIARFLDECVI